MREPDELLGRRVEAAILDHANPRVLAGHVRAAAYEAPLDDGDAAILGTEALERAARDPELKADAGRLSSGPAATTRPRGSAALDRARTRSRSSTRTTGDVLGLVEGSRAYSTVHEGAVYLHLGESYLVRELDLTTLRAVVEPFSRRLVHAGEEGDDDRDRRAAAHERRLGLELVFGELAVTEQVVGYQRKTIARAGDDRARRRSTCRRRASRPRRSGSCRSRASSTASTQMPQLVSGRCTRPSTR